MCWYFDFTYEGCNHDAFEFCVEPCEKGENSRFTGVYCEDAERSEFELMQDCPRCNYGNMPTNPHTAETDPEMPDDFEWHVPSINVVNPGWRNIDWNPPPRVGADPDYDDPPSPRTVPAPDPPLAEPRQSSVASQIPEFELRRKPGRCPLKRGRSSESIAETEWNNVRNITDHILKRPKMIQDANDDSTIMSDSMPPPDIPTRNPARLLSSIINRAKAPSTDASPPGSHQRPQPLLKNRPRPTRLDLSLTTARRPNAHAIQALSSSSLSLIPPLLLPSPLLPLSPLLSSDTPTAVLPTGLDAKDRRSTSTANKARNVVRSLSNPVRKLSKVLRRLSSSISAKVTVQGKKNDTKGKAKAKSSSTSDTTPATPTRCFQGLIEREDELDARKEVREVVRIELGRQKGKWNRVLGRSV